MAWLSNIGPVAAAASVVGAIVWALILWRGNTVWASKADVEGLASKEELNGLGARVSELADQVNVNATLADENKERIDLMDQDLRHRAEMMATSVVQPLQAIATRLEEVHKTQGEMATGQATATADMKALGRTLDDLKDRFGRLEAKAR